MKVRPSVKPICEKCKVIKRKGKVMVICDNPSTNKDKVNKREVNYMARIAGVDIPREKRIVISLTYVYGIGTQLLKIVEEANVSAHV